MKQFWKWSNGVENSDSKLVLEGAVSSEDFYGDEPITPKAFREEISKRTGDLIVSINSPGGDVFSGIAIYNALCEYKGKVTIEVNGLAASIASVIAMAGDEIIMLAGSSMMIHKPWTHGLGNSDELKKVIDTLEKIESSIIPIYTARTGLSEDRIKEMLAEETWLTPKEAVELGFADKAIEAKDGKSHKNLFSSQFLFSMEATKEATAKLSEKIQAETEEVTISDKTDTKEAETETVENSVEKVDKEDEVESEEKETEVEENISNLKKGKEMENEIVIEGIVAKAELPKQEIAPVKATKNEARTHIVSMLAAIHSKDDGKLAELKNDAKFNNVIDGTSGKDLFLEEVLASDIREQYGIFGRVGNLVNKIDIEGAETYAQLVEAAGNGFQPVALGGVKAQDQPVWTKITFDPKEWAVIIAWLDGVQKRSPIAVYNQIVRYIAREYAKLEDKVILTYAGGTYDGETRPATGLVPILTSAGRVTPVNGYGSADIIGALGEAYGEVESDLGLTVVANRRTWAKLATALDRENRPIFNVVGEQVSAGALGTFNVVLSNALNDGDVVIGAYEDYNLVTRGGLGTLFSREATIGTDAGAINLFTQDASALRADIDITGKPIANTSFQLLKFAGYSA